MGIRGHAVAVVRQIPFGGALLAVLKGALARPRAPARAAVPGGTVKNRHFPVDTAASPPYRPDGPRILSGDPVQTATYLFVSADQRFSVGYWTCRPGKWRIDFGDHEFIQILSGVVEVTDAAGETRTYRAGDAFISPAGFSGTWDVIEPVTKHFVLYAEPPAG